jgi:hypothetical protein
MKSLLTVAAVLSVLTLGSAGALAQENPYTKAPPPVPMSATHVLAQSANDPDACIKAVEKSADNVGLRIHGKEGENGRLAVNTMLDAARNAAHAGDNEACWHWYDRAMNRP